jgi:hypothetical protein
MNNTAINYLDPFLSHRNTQIMSDESLQCEDSKIVIRPYLLPHISDLTKNEIETLGGKMVSEKTKVFMFTETNDY